MHSIKARITAIQPLTDRIREFRLTGVAERPLPGWEPGAHVRVSLPDGDSRAYSLIALAPVPEAPAEYRIAVQLEPEGKGGSRFMHGLAEGAEVTLSLPKCDFPLVAGAPAALLAGGIGVTPMISMATALKAAGTPFEFHYAGRSAGLMAYASALAETFGPAFTAHCDDDPATALHLDALLAALGDRHIYACGPRGMLDALRQKAEAAGIPASRVHFELFDAPQAEAGDTAFEVELASTGQTFTIPPDRSIIEVLEEGGVDLVYDCQRGDCGICQCGVISGEPDHRDVVLSEAERAAGKLMQICVSRAKSPRLVLDL
ncbi:MAG: oxidoreductase [Rhodobacterales bacterium 65-51]|uniref:PDR/VanB family oxidoreductase n=1 Tax=uncultured Gemmobacter sp. TaxID=1095917 RepID=UPI00095D3257|nr:PDR/VanB family oxidoreductase [uncultured Gemmobacter sp.]OJY33670.1 MAG: oxidoreductase [Rhodobacterales bacterium 65-51]